MDSSVSARGNPFIGSRISLLSKSQMRYEGVLYQLDEDQSTLALAKVRSFGTEDRVPDRPVAPRDELFDYIVFRAMDIQDIKLSDAPKTPRTLPGGLSFDPAIIQYAVPGSGADAHVASSGGLLNPNHLTRSSSSHGQSASAGYDPLEGLSSSKVGDLLSDLVRPRIRITTTTSAPHQEEVAPPTPNASAQHGDETNYVNSNHSGTIGTRGGRQTATRSRPLQGRPSMNYDAPSYMIRGAYRGNSTPNYYRRPGMPYRGNYSNWNREGNYGNFRSNWNPNYRNYNNQRRNSVAQPRKFSTDYDFERANSKFERIKASTGSKSEKKDENGVSVPNNSSDENQEEPSDEVKVNGNVDVELNEDADKLAKLMEVLSCYDKGRSFFDRISCEADVKHERKDKRKEMAINKQTFGFQPATDYQRMPNSSYYYPSRNNYVNYRGGRGGYNSYNNYGGYNSYNGYGYRGGRFGFRGQYRGRTTMSSRMMETRN